MTKEAAAWLARTPWIALPCALVIGAGLAITQFPAAGNDDTHITYWAAHALAHLGRIVNYNGVAIEQSSSLGLVFLLALIERVGGVAPPWSAPVISMAAAVAAVAGTAAIGRRAGAGPVVGVVAPLITATALPFLYWSTSGMEMTLAAALGLAVIAAVGARVDRGGSLPVAAAAMAAFALIRPESPIVLLCTLVAAVAAAALDGRRTGEAAALKRGLGVLAVGAGLVGVLFAVRFLAFGSIVPNPALMKSGGFALGHGAEYLWESSLATGALFPVAVGAGFAVACVSLFSRARDATTALTLGLAAAGVAFVIGSGGDWMPAGRLIVPVIPALALLAAQAGAALFARQRAVALLVAAAVIALDVRGVLTFADTRQNASLRGPGAGSVPPGLSADGPPYAFSELANRAHRRDVLLLDHLLDAARRIAPTPDRPLIAMSGQAGMVPYYLAREHYGAFTFVDLYALTDPAVLRCVPPEAAHRSVHGVQVGAEVLLARAEELGARCGFHRPDVIFSTGTLPAYLRKFGYKSIYQGPRDLEAYVAIDAALAERIGL